jgi:hypothetical protein
MQIIVNEMKYIFLLFLCLLFFQNCHSSKSLSKQNSTELLNERIEEYINCLNARNEQCLQQLYSKDYESLSPIHKPTNVNIFVQNTIQNLEKNNFIVAVKIREIQMSETLGYVTMNWQLKTKGTPSDDDPFANVQRIDIWKKDTTNNWVIFRTIIYDERTF